MVEKCGCAKPPWYSAKHPWSAHAVQADNCKPLPGAMENRTRSRLLMPKSRPNFYHDFRRCTGCDRIYWPGTHIGSLFHFTLLLSTKPFPSGHGESLVIRVLDRAQFRLGFADLGLPSGFLHTHKVGCSAPGSADPEATSAQCLPRTESWTVRRNNTQLIPTFRS
jgi:hypothetical protein